MERRLAAILAADVVGYTALMGADEVGTLRRLTELRQNILDPLITEHHGRIVKLMGDGLLVEFASVVDSVACALAWQEEVTKHEAVGDENTRLRFRIGINLGDVIVEDGDIHGDGVNIAARLEGLAEPGGIYLSGDAYRQARGKTKAEFDDLGERDLKNVAEPVRVFRIVGGNSKAASFPMVEPLRLPDKPSIAVLPFTNMSSDPEQDYFADGLTEDIITRLSYLRGVTVISRTSSFVFKGQTKQVREISEELGVNHVLEGSVRKSSDRLRVVAQLIDGKTGSHLWAKRYDRQVVDIFDLQDEITHAIVVALQVTLSDGEMALDPGGTEDYAAWEAFQQGALAHLKYTAEDNLRARRLYAEAFERDPDFIDAKVFHAWTYWQHARSGFAKNREKEIAECRRTLDTLLEAGATTANVKHLESVTLLLERKYDSALSVSDVAVALGPSKLLGYTPAAIVNIYSGRFQAAADILRETIRTIPCTPNDTIYNLAWVLGLMGDASRALTLAEEYMRRVPDDLFAYTTLAIAHGLAGSRDRARATISMFRERFPSYRVSDFEAHEPFRDPNVLKKVLVILKDAGLPD